MYDSYYGQFKLPVQLYCVFLQISLFNCERKLFNIESDKWRELWCSSKLIFDFDQNPKFLHTIGQVWILWMSRLFIFLHNLYLLKNSKMKDNLVWFQQFFKKK